MTSTVAALLALAVWVGPGHPAEPLRPLETDSPRFFRPVTVTVSLTADDPTGPRFFRHVVIPRRNGRAISVALATETTRGRGVIVHFPPGFFRVKSEPAEMPSGTTLQGAGWHVTTLQRLPGA